MDIYQQKALDSWYKEGHELRLEPRHPLIALAGEAGEILNLYKKHEYKPNFSWWKCKNCGFMPEDKKKSEVDYFAFTCFNGEKHTPLVLDELGDFWYYLRILAWQQELELKSSDEDWSVLDMLDLLSMLADYSIGLLRGWIDSEAIAKNYLLNCYEILLTILLKLDCSIDQLTELNYKKLNSDVSQHGWARAK